MVRFGAAVQAFIESAGNRLTTVDLSSNEYDLKVIVDRAHCHHDNWVGSNVLPPLYNYGMRPIN